MKPNIIKATMAMEVFFTYHVTPEEFSSFLGRLQTTNERDSSILQSLTDILRKNDVAGI